MNSWFKLSLYITYIKYSVNYKKEYLAEVRLFDWKSGRANTANTAMYTINNANIILLILYISRLHILELILALPGNLTSGCVHAENSISMSGCGAGCTAVYPG